MFIKENSSEDLSVAGLLYDGFEEDYALTTDYQLVLYDSYGHFTTSNDNGSI